MRVPIEVRAGSRGTWCKGARLGLRLARKYPYLGNISVLMYDMPGAEIVTSGQIGIVYGMWSERYRERVALGIPMFLEATDSWRTAWQLLDAFTDSNSPQKELYWAEHERTLKEETNGTASS